MSIALEGNSNSRIGMSSVSIYDSSKSVSGILADDCCFPVANTTIIKVVSEEDSDDSCSSSSSSIGRNSDTSSAAGEVDSGEGDEVQSSYKEPLDALDALEEVLPIKRGISKFYCGKSKSFTSLGDASSCSTIRDIAKPENAYTRKRKNLLAFNAYFDKNHSNCLRSNNNIGGISKRPANSRSTLAIAMTMGSSESTDNSESSNSDSSSPNRCLPPLHPHSRRPTTNSESVVSPPRHKTSPWRSFSLSDLQGASAAIPRINGLVTDNGDD